MNGQGIGERDRYMIIIFHIGYCILQVHYGTRENSIQLNFGENFEDANYRVDFYEAFTFHQTETASTFNFTTSIKVSVGVFHL